MSCIQASVSNEMGQCNFSGQRDRSSIIVPQERDKLKILPRDVTEYPKSGLGQDAGQNGTEQKRMF